MRHPGALSAPDLHRHRCAHTTRASAIPTTYSLNPSSSALHRVFSSLPKAVRRGDGIATSTATRTAVPIPVLKSTLEAHLEDPADAEGVNGGKCGGYRVPRVRRSRKAPVASWVFVGGCVDLSTMAMMYGFVRAAMRAGLAEVGGVSCGVSFWTDSG